MKNTIDLLDINVLIALTVEEHIHHERAQDYWSQEAAKTLCICRISMLGLLRLLGNSAAMAGQVLTPSAAWDIYIGLISDPVFRFADEPDLIDLELEGLAKGKDMRHRQWTDAYLAAFAKSGGYRLVSFDADFGRFSGLNFLHLKG